MQAPNGSSFDAALGPPRSPCAHRVSTPAARSFFLVECFGASSVPAVDFSRSLAQPAVECRLVHGFRQQFSEDLRGVSFHKPHSRLAGSCVCASRRFAPLMMTDDPWFCAGGAEKKLISTFWGLPKFFFNSSWIVRPGAQDLRALRA